MVVGELSERRDGLTSGGERSRRRRQTDDSADNLSLRGGQRRQANISSASNRVVAAGRLDIYAPLMRSQPWDTTSQPWAEYNRLCAMGAAAAH